jgi:hypothetical protein
MTMEVAPCAYSSLPTMNPPHQRSHPARLGKPRPNQLMARLFSGLSGPVACLKLAIHGVYGMVPEGGRSSGRRGMWRPHLSPGRIRHREDASVCGMSGEFGWRVSGDTAEGQTRTAPDSGGKAARGRATRATEPAATAD